MKEKGQISLTPEQVSLGFFQAIYIDKDVTKASGFVTDDIKQVIMSYHIASQVQRHVLGLSMNNVTLSVSDIDIDFFRRFTDDVTVVVKIEGKRGDQDWVDDRTLRLQKKVRTWVIVEIMPEKGRIEG
ncbi:hypothetical protein [Shewanella maritima]|uniref:hypothetical protein n=1 Tax=Shewanella maritima TaxID=2520507 RepID=UPI003735F179